MKRPGTLYVSAGLILLMSLMPNGCGIFNFNKNQKRASVRVIAMALADSTTCAVFDNGRVACVGQMKNLTRTPWLSPEVTAAQAKELELPFAVKQLAIARGKTGLHACALSAEGKVFCWGGNAAGQSGEPADQKLVTDMAEKAGLPVKQLAALRPLTAVAQIPLGQKAIAVTTGYAHSCALGEFGFVLCWGENIFGQLGLGAKNGGSKLEKSAVPVMVALTTRDEAKQRISATQIAAGKNHTCALLSNGKVRCWGDNNFGQAGYVHRYAGTGMGALNSVVGTLSAPAEEGYVATVTAAEESAGLKARAIAAASDRSCAVLTSGAVRCWGENRWHKLGYAQAFDKISTATSPAELGDIRLGAATQAVALHDIHTCALSESGPVYCWGLNETGQLGLPGQREVGKTGTMPPPAVPLTGPNETARPVAVAAGAGHSCALFDNGKMRCWGLGFDGQLGQGFGKKYGNRECMNFTAYCLGDEENELPPPDLVW